MSLLKAIPLASLVYDFFFGLSAGVGALFFSIIVFLRHGRKKLFAKIYGIDVIGGLILLYLAVGILFSDGDLTILLTFIKVVLISSVCYRFIKINTEIDALPKFLAIACILQALFVLFVFLYPQAEAFGNFLRPSNSHLFNTYGEDHPLRFRLYPASGQLVSGLAIVIGFCFLVLTASLVKNRGRHRTSNLVLLISGTASAIVLGFLSGRSFLIFPLFLCLFLLAREPRKFLLYFSIFLLGVAAYLFVSGGFSNNLNRWLFEPVYRLLSEGRLATLSTDNLFERHLFIPSSDFILAHSFSFKSDGIWTAGTDSGWLRYLYLGGPIFLLLLISFHTSSFKSILKMPANYALHIGLIFLVLLKQEFSTNASAVGLSILSYAYFAKVFYASRK